MKNTYFVLKALLVGSLLISFGVLSYSFLYKNSTPKNSLIIAQDINSITTIDPADTVEAASGELVTNVYDRLIQYDAINTFDLLPGLAKEWSVDVEKRQISFTLRQGVKFHSGNPLRAADVIFSFSRVVELNLAPAFIFKQLGWNTENIHQMVTSVDDVITVRYDNAHSPIYVLNILASRAASIVDEKLVMQHERHGDLGNAWLNENSAGTGPFMLKHFAVAQRLELVANSDYFNGKPSIEKIVFNHVVSSDEQLDMLQSGVVDMIKNLQFNTEFAIDPEQYVRKNYPQATLHFLSFNQKFPELRSAALWEAARYLVDYKGITDKVLNGQVEVHQAFWPKGFAGSYFDSPYSYDVEKAKKILKDKGFKTPVTIELAVLNASPYLEMAVAIQTSFAAAGVNFEIRAQKASDFLSIYGERRHEAALVDWDPDFIDPHSNAKSFAYNIDNRDDRAQPSVAWRNAWEVPVPLNQLTSQALQEHRSGERLSMYADLQKQLQLDSPIVMMFQANSQVVMSKKIKNYVNGITPDLIFYRLVRKK